jgi:FAD/FMN-containing dehydrogenase
MSVQREVVSELRAALNGRVIVPEDKDYEQARTVFYGGIDRRPQAMVRVADPGDVAHVISLARQTGLELAVRGGGHSFAGHSLSDGGIVLDLRELQSLQIDPERRTAWAGGGLTAGAYTQAAGELGLATGFGDTGSVGIGGLTLGGGVGYLVRKYGLTIDQLLAADVVTADGQLLRADEHAHPDLFWALRGGGGNFGVVTRFQFRLQEVPSVVGGMLILPATPAIIAGFIAAAEAAPEELSTIASIMPAPPLPMVPAEQHGQLVVFAFLVYAGEVDAGERAMAPFRKLAAPIVDMLRPMTYPEIFAPEEEYHPTAVARTMLVDRVDPGVGEEIVDRLESSDAPVRVAQLRVLGGAMARVPAEATAYAHRASRIMVNLAAFYESREEQVEREAWVSDFAASLQQGDHGVYVNFLGEASEAQVRLAYPRSTWDRLAAVKHRYDPTNLFRVNHNIPPARP